MIILEIFSVAYLEDATIGILVYGLVWYNNNFDKKFVKKIINFRLPFAPVGRFPVVKCPGKTSYWIYQINRGLENERMELRIWKTWKPRVTQDQTFREI